MNIHGAILGFGIALALVGFVATITVPVSGLSGKATTRLLVCSVAAFVIGVTLIGATAKEAA